ncbi:hypothetical protein B0H21DRAFT_888504 [Amylocystis lapponica]|nr:hypothetical protein B0H21DRAFT_888504 [Amylocystis lapponica]
MASPAHHFNKPSADIILISSDDVEFRVHRIILAEASTFFETLFALPQPASTQFSGAGEQTANHTDPNGLPVINVTETSAVLESLLRLCYPIRDPVLTDITVIRGILEAAVKYDMDEAKELMRKRLLGLASAEPLRVYAIACLHALEDVALAAAKEVLQQKLQSSYVEEMEEITAGDYSRLMGYSPQKGKRKKPYSFSRISMTPAASEASTESAPIEPSDAPHPFNLPNADAILCSSNAVNFRVHRMILAMASPVLEEKLAHTSLFTGDGSEAPQETNAGQTGLPIVYLPESSRTILVLLQIYYPFNDPELNDTQDIITILTVAEKYGMKKAVRSLKALAMSTLDMKSEPLQAYLIAIRLGMREQAIVAARYTLERVDLNKYSTNMEEVSAGSYYRLLQYRRHCVEAACNAVRDWGLENPVSNEYCHNSRSWIKSGCWETLVQTEFIAALAEIPVGLAVITGAAASAMKRLDSSAACSSCRSSRDLLVQTSAVYLTLSKAVDEKVLQVNLEWK